MKGYVGNIETATAGNEDFRHVLYTGGRLQLVLMTIPPGGEIGEETHEHTDQFFRIESGKGAVMLDGVPHEISDGMAVLVPAGTRHNVTNPSSEPLRLYTLYAPPEHQRDTVRHTKSDAAANPETFDGVTDE